MVDHAILTISKMEEIEFSQSASETEEESPESPESPEYPDDVLITKISGTHRTVYILTGEEFDFRVFGVHLDFDDKDYYFCENSDPWHPNIEFQPPGYEFCCKICKCDLEDTSSDYASIMSLRKLIQQPKVSCPYNIDANIMYRKDPVKFREKQAAFKVGEKNPFGEIEFSIKKGK